MTHGDATLPGLPAELVQDIAIHLPCSSILSLSLTSKRLFAKCYNRHVFKRKAANAIYYEKYHDMASLDLDAVEVENWELQTCDSEASEEGSEDEEWWTEFQEDISPEDDWDYADYVTEEQYRLEKAHEQRIATWPDRTVFDSLSAGDSARVAFAVEKAQQWFNVPMDQQPKNRSCDWRKGVFAFWLPHLFTIRHPSVFALKPEHLHFLLCEPTENENPECIKNSCLIEYLNSAYCMVMLMLSRVEKMALVPEELRYALATEPFLGSGCFRLDFPDVLMDMTWVMTPNKVRLDFEDRYTTILYMVFKIFTARSPRDVPLPLVDRLPLSTLIKNPIPFRTPGVEMHDIRMTPQETINFLDGIWVGWYATQVNESITAKLSRTQSILITAREAIPSDPPDCIAIIKGQHNSDSFATSQFHGIVNKQGDVSISYEYATERSLWPHHDMRRVGREDRCYGYITPFGIVGWLDPADRVEHCFREMSDIFWMYRKEWSYREE
ncbi:hypothetical protein GT037_008866 [Alternaria burnsii]|uniref:F-box domain-containing protein n=1 Tax=Alternaria burnsii TaxID=1187904 RepID=A0A8H7AY95_9PLEO|nr:uncharacterized protein GT037_008866 [Alternaria burnsii]KAF7672915.1 hypothetical protein GT037_008866 [Alternaria burnsii]